MRKLIAGLMAIVALGLAAPAQAQEVRYSYASGTGTSVRITIDGERSGGELTAKVQYSVRDNDVGVELRTAYIMYVEEIDGSLCFTPMSHEASTHIWGCARIDGVELVGLPVYADNYYVYKILCLDGDPRECPDLPMTRITLVRMTG